MKEIWSLKVSVKSCIIQGPSLHFLLLLDLQSTVSISTKLHRKPEPRHLHLSAPSSSLLCSIREDQMRRLCFFLSNLRRHRRRIKRDPLPPSSSSSPQLLLRSAQAAVSFSSTFCSNPQVLSLRASLLHRQALSAPSLSIPTAARSFLLRLKSSNHDVSGLLRFRFKPP